MLSICCCFPCRSPEPEQESLLPDPPATALRPIIDQHLPLVRFETLRLVDEQAGIVMSQVSQMVRESQTAAMIYTNSRQTLIGVYDKEDKKLGYNPSLGQFKELKTRRFNWPQMRNSAYQTATLVFSQSLMNGSRSSRSKKMKWATLKFRDFEIYFSYRYCASNVVVEPDDPTPFYIFDECPRSDGDFTLHRAKLIFSMADFSNCPEVLE